MATSDGPRRAPRDYRPDLRPILIIGAAFVAVVVGWMLLSDRILPRPPAGDLTDDPTGVYTRTPEEPLRTTLELRGGRYALDAGQGPALTGDYERVKGELRFADDASCGDAVGRYAATQGRRDRYGLLPEHTAETLTLLRVDDACAGRSERLSGEWVLRRSLREGVYGICDPPNEEAAITGHWPQPTGCADQ